MSDTGFRMQLQLPDRVGDWHDVWLNAASGTAGWLVAFAHHGIRRGRRPAARSLP